MKSMPIVCQRPLAIDRGCRKLLGLPLQGLVRWHKSQPASYRCISRHICFHKYWSFARRYIRSAQNCPPARVSCALRRIGWCIALGIPNRSLFSAFPSSSFCFVLTVISTPSSLSFFFAFPIFSTCIFSKSPHSHSSSTDTHSLHSLVDAVDGAGRGLGLAREHAIGPNYSSSTMPAWMTSIYSPAALSSSDIKFHLSQRKCGQRDIASATSLLTPGVCLSSHWTFCWAVRISICRTVRCSSVSIKRKVAWSWNGDTWPEAGSVPVYIGHRHGT